MCLLALNVNMKQQGFTLIEILVSVALFSVVMVVALGALLSMSVSIRKAEAINSSINNLSAAMDAISRTVRTGTNYHCGSGGTLSVPQDCALDSFFSYLNYDGNQVNYCLADVTAPTTCVNGVTCPTGKSCEIIRLIAGGSYQPLTSPEINITSLGFYVTGSLRSDTEQPKVTIVVASTIPVTSNTTTDFNLQTSVTQRIYDQ